MTQLVHTARVWVRYSYQVHPESLGRKERAEIIRVESESENTNFDWQARDYVKDTCPSAEIIKSRVLGTGRYKRRQHDSAV